MGQVTPNVSIYIPAAGETNYEASFSAGMVNIDQHDHTGAPTKGVLINTTGLADGSVTYPKLNANVADVATGIGVDAGNPNKLQILGLLQQIFALAPLTNGQLIIGSTGLSPAKAVPTAGTGISIATGAGSLTITNTGAVPGAVVQYVQAVKATFQDCATILQIINSIPPITEGDEVITCTITPKSATNLLVIKFSTFGTVSAASIGAMALFQDATVGALAASSAWTGQAAGETWGNASFTHKMVSGTAVATTFRVRCGPYNGASHFYINGSSAGVMFGGVASTTLEIWEIQV
jgi:hypothetical protein